MQALSQIIRYRALSLFPCFDACLKIEKMKVSRFLNRVKLEQFYRNRWLYRHFIDSSRNDTWKPNADRAAKFILFIGLGMVVTTVQPSSRD